MPEYIEALDVVMESELTDDLTVEEIRKAVAYVYNLIIRTRSRS